MKIFEYLRNLINRTTEKEELKEEKSEESEQEYVMAYSKIESFENCYVVTDYVKSERKVFNLENKLEKQMKIKL